MSQSIQFFRSKPTDGISCVPVSIATEHLKKTKLVQFISNNKNLYSGPPKYLNLCFQC